MSKGGFGMALDFKGGTVVVVRFNETVDIGEIRDLLPRGGYSDGSVDGRRGSEFQIGLEKAVENEDESVGSEAVTTGLEQGFRRQV